MINKLLSTFLILIFCSFGTKAYANHDEETELWTNDRQVHMAATLGISSGLYLFLGNSKLRRADKFWISFVATVAIGAIKEAADRNPSQYDMIANGAGALTGSLLMVTFDF